MHLNKQSSDRHNRSEMDDLSNNQSLEHKNKLMVGSVTQDIRDRELRTSGQIGASSSATGVSRTQKTNRNISEKESSVVSKSSPKSLPNQHSSQHSAQHSAQSAIIPVLNEVFLSLKLINRKHLTNVLTDRSPLSTPKR